MSQLSLIPKDIVIYHDNCPDGTMAAWIAYQKLGKGCELIKAQYGDKPPPNLASNNVYILDFSYKRKDVEQIKDSAKNFVLLDHHESARIELDGLVEVDISKSGARLAWDFFFPGKDPPDMVLYIEDSDLWKFELEGSRAHRAYIATVRKTVADYQTILGIPLSTRLRLGEDELKKVDEYVYNQTARAFLVQMDGHEVYACPAEKYISEVGHKLCRGKPFSVTWFENQKTGERVYSLRSDENGMDVSLIAAKLGGGGHKRAAGFTTKLETWPW